MRTIVAVPAMAAALGFAPAPGEAQDMQNAPAVLTAPGARYVFGQISGYRRDHYMLDTQTGRLWVIVTDREKIDWLEEVPYKPGQWPAAMVSEEKALLGANDAPKKDPR